MDKTRISYLLQRYAGEGLSPAEMEELAGWLGEEGQVVPALEALLQEAPEDKTLAALDWQPLLQSIVGLDRPPVTAPAAPRRRLPGWTWYRYAAVVLILLGLGAAAWILGRRQATVPEPLTVNPSTPIPPTTDISPGGNKALLHLADGTIILLDSAADGLLAQQGDAAVIKQANGEIVYRLKGKAAGPWVINTMSTPRGGQYQLTLPDGTRVWLNAASSISYPTAFTGPNRKVRISGELYFEVAANAGQPFLVESDGASVEVLGTSFNINAYTNEASTDITLLQGRVRAFIAEGGAAGQPGPATDRRPRNSVLLQPGQQARVTTGINVNDKVDTDKVMAWKNGQFNFEGASLEQLMRQLERWYDIEVVYEGTAPTVKFFGKMTRKVELSAVLRALKGFGIRFRMEEGRRLVVLG